jgi:hypothetical protein
MKPGATTTEFWLCVLGVVLLFTADALQIELSSLTQWAITGLIGVYVGGRSFVKAAREYIPARGA